MVQRVLKLPKKILYRLWNYGPWDVYWWLVNHFESGRRERRLGISTAAVIQPEALGYAPDATGYDPISYASMDAILDDLTIDARKDVFVDIGSGLGRAVIMAATRPFKRVVGIELNEGLYQSSLQQITRAKPFLTCPDVSIERADATQYEYPADVTVLFIWNSFLGEILDAVMERIRQHHLAHPGPLTLVYAIPAGDPDTLQRHPWLCERREIKTRFWTGIRVIRYTIDSSRQAGSST